uniref:DH domain-containing protein n=1 Tax=Chelonoidis abingdonii TaxID=106734 RepID=A0A8C0J3Z6_CHEAB
QLDITSQARMRTQESWLLSHGHQSQLRITHPILRCSRLTTSGPMLTLAILPEAELREIFGTLDSLAPLHEGTAWGGTPCPMDGGRMGAHFLPRLQAYESYCCHQVWAKAQLDRRKREPAVGEFLRLCQESAFSRKLELWSFLDLPRSRLVKYPLLLREVLRQTPLEHPDHGALQRADLVGLINRKTGEAECRYYQQRLSYPDGTPRHPGIDRSNLLLCHGELRNSKGLHVFLFQEALVLTRPILQGEQIMFQVQGRPMPVGQLEVQDLPDGGARLGGALRERGRCPPGTTPEGNTILERPQGRYHAGGAPEGGYYARGKIPYWRGLRGGTTPEGPPGKYPTCRVLPSLPAVPRQRGASRWGWG